jgi:HD-GYP domain-containing protein (c-di-GMP phosphodiesterase class II)
MEGLFIDKNNKYINQIKQDNLVLKLIATGDEVDVMMYEVWADDMPAHITPGENPNLMEFYYILEGTVLLKLDNNDEVLFEKGEHFYVYKLKHNIQFTTKDGAKFLYVSSKPLFKYLANYYEDLTLLLNQSEENDIYTYNHGNRVQMYSIKICEKLMLSKEIIESLQISSLFHDIGKCNVPYEILNKPSNLTDYEYSFIKKHSLDGGKFIKDKFSERITKIVEQHHERLDGTGYPMGLKAGEILIEARIIAVADTYDAMTSDRAYRMGYSPKFAMEELEKLAGIHYDKAVVNALHEILVEENVLK